MRIIVRCHPPEHYEGGAEFALIELDKVNAKALLDRRDKLAAIIAEDSTFSSGSFWDRIPLVFCQSDLTEAQAPAMDDLQDELFADNPVDAPPGFAPASDFRMESCRLVISAEGIYWRFLEKHTDWYIETIELAWSTIEAALAGAESLPV